VLLLLRLIAGVAGAVTFIVGASLATQLAAGASPARAAVLLGIYFAGGGLGVAVSGLLIPLLLSATGPSGWRWGWLVLGTLAFAATAAAVPAARRAPLPGRSSRGTVSAWRAGPVAVILGAYALFGAGYIAYVTFIIAFLKGQGAGTVELSGFWVVLGLAAIGSTFAWGPLLARLRGGRGIALASAVVTLGAAIPLLSGSVRRDVRLSRAVRRLVPGRANRRHRVRSPRPLSPPLDDCDRRPDGRVRAGTMSRTGTRRRALRRTQRRTRRAHAIRPDPRRRGTTCRRPASARARPHYPVGTAALPYSVGAILDPSGRDRSQAHPPLQTAEIAHEQRR